MNPPLTNGGRRNQPKYRTGIGFDAHELASGRQLMLGGVHIPSRLGLLGHSDADVLLHALTDALLGSLALPDIGAQFPDTDARWKDADSKLLLGLAYRQVKSKGHRLMNADCIVICDRPRLLPYSAAIRRSIAKVLDVPPDCIGLQAKTTEGTQLALRRKSIAAMATVLVGAGPIRSPGSGVHSPKSSLRRAR